VTVSARQSSPSTLSPVTTVHRPQHTDLLEKWASLRERAFVWSDVTWSWALSPKLVWRVGVAYRKRFLTLVAPALWLVKNKAEYMYIYIRLIKGAKIFFYNQIMLA
jgi:hypothetical protein